MKNMEHHCAVRPRAMAVASGLDITTLEPNKIFTVTMYNIYTAAPVPLDLLWEGPEASLAGGQLLALWEEGVWNSLCLFTSL